MPVTFRIFSRDSILFLAVFLSDNLASKLASAFSFASFKYFERSALTLVKKVICLLVIDSTASQITSLSLISESVMISFGYIPCREELK